MLTIAQRFSAGASFESNRLSPSGTKETGLSSLTGLVFLETAVPSTEVLGYFPPIPQEVAMHVPDACVTKAVCL